MIEFKIKLFKEDWIKVQKLALEENTHPHEFCERLLKDAITDEFQLKFLD